MVKDVDQGVTRCDTHEDTDCAAVSACVCHELTWPYSLPPDGRYHFEYSCTRAYIRSSRTRTALQWQTPWSERKAFLKVIWTVVISPFGKVRFLEGYVGDILTR